MQASTSPTLTFNTRQRSGSLSLIARSLPALFTLPAELTLDILETAILLHKPTLFALARTCRYIARFIDIILYRTVVLRSPRALALFSRTCTATPSKPPSFFANHVKTLVVAAFHFQFPLNLRQLSDIVAACPGLRTVALPTDLAPVLPFVPAFRDHQDLSPPCEIILDTYTSLPDALAPHTALCASLSARGPVLPSITRLRVCEPSDTWLPPFPSIAPVLPNLTHLHLARRAHANEENDAAFLHDVRAFLRWRRIRMVVVSVFPGMYASSDPADLRASSIWAMLAEIAREDERLVLVEGAYGTWAREWERGAPVICAQSTPLDFWERAKAARA